MITSEMIHKAKMDMVFSDTLNEYDHGYAYGRIDMCWELLMKLEAYERFDCTPGSIIKMVKEFIWWEADYASCKALGMGVAEYNGSLQSDNH